MQNIDEISDVIVPYFKKNTLTGQKKKDFDVWHKAVEIVWGYRVLSELGAKDEELN